MERKLRTLRKDLTGKRFGKLTVLSREGSKEVGKSKKLQTQCKCLCDCGIEKILFSGVLLSGNTTSCECNQVKPKELGESNFNMTLRIYKRNAKKRGHTFLLSKDEFKELIGKNCYYCNSLPNNIANAQRTNGAFIYNGIDRINSDEDYIISNCVPCCKICNIVKHNLTMEEFLSCIERVYNYSLNKLEYA